MRKSWIKQQMALHGNGKGQAPTPGPWLRYNADCGDWDIIVSRDSDRSTIARLFASTISAGHGGSAEANARLIAAAPDLLTALKTLVNTPEVRHEDMQAAHAAIKKAEGQP